ncbi:MAG: rod-binding protein [Treponema sp.]|jgi:flagellar protein FlgJ|nr:rod-binding protein [Treponema sp.]
MEISGLGATYSFDYQGMSPADILTESAYKTPDFASILERAQKTDAPIVSANKKVGKIDKSDRLYQACLELETFLVKNLLTSMRSTVQKSSLIEQGFAGKMYEDMLYDEYAKVLAQNAGFGLAEQAYLQLTN